MKNNTFDADNICWHFKEQWMFYWSRCQESESLMFYMPHQCNSCSIHSSYIYHMAFVAVIVIQLGQSCHSGRALDCMSTGWAIDPAPGAWFLTKIHLISPGCLPPSIALKCRIVAENSINSYKQYCCSYTRMGLRVIMYRMNDWVNE